MPTPGSRKHDVEQSRLRREAEEKGINDDRAETAAETAMARDEDVAPAETDDRADGPYGEREGSQD